jgi:hypothetical protein
MFGNSCPLNQHVEVKVALEVTQESFEAKYLGMPALEGRMTK